MGFTHNSNSLFKVKYVGIMFSSRFIFLSLDDDDDENEKRTEIWFNLFNR